MRDRDRCVDDAIEACSYAKRFRVRGKFRGRSLVITLMFDHEGAAEADHAMRHWTHRSDGAVRIGSEAHLRMFCTMLLATHNPYKPAVIDWPRLSPDTQARVTSLPIWDIAV